MRRLPYLDSLRGFAAIYVAIYHTTLLPAPNLVAPHWLAPIVAVGGTGVTLFFVVSAFSLCLSMQERETLASTLITFYSKRFFRIAPLFYTVIGFYLVRDQMYFGSNHSISEILESIFFVFNFIPGHEQGFVWASWTIGVEMVFYVIFPFLFYRFRDIGSIITAFLASILISILFQEILLHFDMPNAIRTSYLWFSFIKHMPVFIFGIFVYICHEQVIANARISKSVGSALILASLCAYAALITGRLEVFFIDLYYWQAIVYSMLLIGLSINPHPFLVNRMTTYLGKISYSVYLVHPSVILFLFPLYIRIYAIHVPVSLKYLLSVAMTLSAVVAVASITYRYIELPGMSLGKRVLAARRPVQFSRKGGI